MKRFLTALLLAAVATCLTLPAHAGIYGNAGPYLQVEQVKWTFHKATAGTGETLINDVLNASTSCTACRVDSIEYNRLGATGATIAVTQACTTAAIPTSGWTKGPSSFVGDSGFTARVVFGNGGAHGAGDSLIIGILVSADAVNWNYANPIIAVAGADPIAATSPAVAGYVLLEQGGDGGVYSMHFSCGVSGALPDRFNVWQWPFIKFVVLNEHAATVHNLTCKVIHWAVD